ncbi:MAG TPA: flagellar basal body L-ring protein FlgH, partial [Anaerolineae bacterium]|nr:flagellar basal body L-ring protein FlgH [Anaerolineae bacterium]
MRALWTVLVLCAWLAQAAQAQSLYEPGAYQSLAADHKAFRIGDVVTVQVIENASAAANADTGSRRS